MVKLVFSGRVLCFLLLLDLDKDKGSVPCWIHMVCQDTGCRFVRFYVVMRIVFF